MDFLYLSFLTVISFIHSLTSLLTIPIFMFTFEAHLLLSYCLTYLRSFYFYYQTFRIT